MEKTSTEPLKEDDIKILTELHYNAKENIEKLAKRCGFSTQKVRRTIKQLEDRRIIWGYSAITDTMKMNQKQFILCIKRNNKPLENKTIEKISNINLENLFRPLDLHIVCTYFVHGTFDWLIVCTGEDLRQARKLCDILYTEFSGLIEHIDIQQILHTHRKQYIFNPDQKRLRDLLK